LDRVTTSLNRGPDLEAHLEDIGAGIEIIALRRLGDADDANDAVQETLARLLVRVREGRVSDRHEMELVAYGIARHVITDLLRARGRHAVLDSEQHASPGDALQSLIADEEGERLRACLATLSPEDRTLLERCFVAGERIGHIAQALGEPAERVRKRKSRALARLCEAIKGAAKSTVTKRDPRR
jgi:RNA polymerase sigma factor (sigma-70 family)